MTGTELLLLFNNVNSGDRRSDLITGMANHDVDFARKWTRAAQHMFNQGIAGREMKYFRVLRFHSGTLTRGENQDSDISHETISPPASRIAQSETIRLFQKQLLQDGPDRGESLRPQPVNRAPRV